MSILQTAYYQSPIGLIEIKVADNFVSSILFVEEKGLNTGSHPLLKNCIEQLAQYFTGERKIIDFPIKQIGTDFQQKVWNELLNIPFGKTISYLHLSKKVGDIKAIRAVGTSNGKNRIVIVIPCHRVIGSDGSLTGYVGGLWRKQWLLNHENNLISLQKSLFEVKRE